MVLATQKSSTLHWSSLMWMAVSEQNAKTDSRCFATNPSLTFVDPVKAILSML